LPHYYIEFVQYLNMRALVISGGGSKGAFAGGLSEYLITQKKRNYEIYIGSSTGSLLVPLLSIGEIDKLKKVFTSTTQTDIFNNCPFIVREKKGIVKTHINHLGIIKMFFKKKKTFGESLNLRQLISKTITEQDYQKIKNTSKEVTVTVSNLTTMMVEYKNANDYDYNDFCDWIWASTSLVPFMSLVTKDNCEYADGGMGDFVPIYQAIKKGATEIDVIFLKSDTSNKTPIQNALELTGRVFEFMLNQIARDGLIIGKIEGLRREITINFYHPPKPLTSNSLIFNPEQMKKWWDYGFIVGKENNPDSNIISIL